MTTSTPDWLQNFTPQPGRGNFVKGKSGNPAGRPPGIVDKRQRISQAFLNDAHDIAKRVVQAALDGDLQAANIVLSRVQPVLKARAEKVTFALNPDANLTDQARQILVAISVGALDAETGKLLIDSLSSFGSLQSNDQFRRELDLLYESRGMERSQGRGGVIEFDSTKGNPP